MGRALIHEITETQTLTMREIIAFIEENGHAPSVYDIAERRGLRHQSVSAHVDHLARKGYLVRDKGKGRTIRVLKGLNGERPTALIPIVGSVVAGYPVLSEENVCGQATIDAKFTSGAPTFALNVTGESMRDADIRDGDIVIVRKQSDAVHGDIVVAMIGGEATVKRLLRAGKIVQLLPANPDFEPITVRGELEILGKVIGLNRCFK